MAVLLMMFLVSGTTSALRPEQSIAINTRSQQVLKSSASSSPLTKDDVAVITDLQSGNQSIQSDAHASLMQASDRALLNHRADSTVKARGNWESVKKWATKGNPPAYAMGLRAAAVGIAIATGPQALIGTAVGGVLGLAPAAWLTWAKIRMDRAWGCARICPMNLAQGQQIKKNAAEDCVSEFESSSSGLGYMAESGGGVTAAASNCNAYCEKNGNKVTILKMCMSFKCTQSGDKADCTCKFKCLEHFGIADEVCVTGEANATVTPGSSGDTSCDNA